MKHGGHFGASWEQVESRVGSSLLQHERKLRADLINLVAGRSIWKQIRSKSSFAIFQSRNTMLGAEHGCWEQAGELSSKLENNQEKMKAG